MTEEPVFFDKNETSGQTQEEALQDTPKKAQLPVQKPNLVIPGIVLLFLFSIVLGTGYMVIRNRLYKKQLATDLNKPKFSDLVPSQKPTTASLSGQINPTTYPSYAPSLVDGGSNNPTTKGGLPVEPTKAVTPTPTPTKKPAVKGDSTSKPVAQNNTVKLTKVYFDAQYPYRISFTDGWYFQRTFGANTGNNEDQILSAVEIYKSNSRVSLNLLRGRGISDIVKWIKETPYSEAPNQNGEEISFAGNRAIRYTYHFSDGREAQKIYFIKGAVVYRLYAVYENSLSGEAKAILNSFIPDTRN
jgi:hypothetical protein